MVFYQLYNYFNKNNNIFDPYQNILEFIPTIKLKIKEQNIIESQYNIIQTISSFCKSINQTKFIISLSGGIDSMVLITILHWLDYNVVACHINYNNRPETTQEQKFIEEWCYYNNIKLYVKSIDEIKRNNTKRSDYEIITKNIRLDFYKEIMQKENTNYILLGHHKDDIIENIVANICRGRNILDLAVIKKISIINNINIGRPMIDYYKSTIYEFAHNYQVPYFKDSTPSWSVRGKYRNEIYPAIESAFTTNVKENLISLSIQSNEWNSIINQKIITPFMDQLEWGTNEDNKIYVKFNIEKYIDYPLSFWSVVFMNIFTKNGYNCPSKKGIQTFLNTIKKRSSVSYGTKYNVTLSNTCICTVKNSVNSNSIKVNILFKNI
jgi:tRNA(Ile)-lysidine synthetase-like protein